MYWKRENFAIFISSHLFKKIILVKNEHFIQKSFLLLDIILKRIIFLIIEWENAEMKFFENIENIFRAFYTNPRMNQ